MRTKGLIISFVAIGGAVVGIATAAAAQSTPTPIHVAPMVRECQLRPGALPSPSAHLTDAQIAHLCDLPGATK